MIQRAVSLGVSFLQNAELAHGVATALDADALGGHPDPCRTLANHFDPGKRPRGAGVEAGGDVQPFDVHRSVEVRGVRGATHQDARLVVGRVLGREIPKSVLGQGCRRGVAGGGAADEVLLLDVTEGRTVERRSPEHHLPGPTGDRPLDRGLGHSAHRGCHGRERRLGDHWCLGAGGLGDRSVGTRRRVRRTRIVPRTGEQCEDGHDGYGTNTTTHD